MNTEEKYPEIRDKLRKLPRIKAREDFLSRLLNKINLLENQPEALSHQLKEEKDKEFHLEKSFSQKVLEKFRRRKPIWNWLIPTVSFAIIILVIFSYLLVVRNTDTYQVPTPSPQTTQQTEIKTSPFKEEIKTDKVQPELKNENVEYSELREESFPKKEITSKETPKVSNESGMVAPIDRKDLDIKNKNEPPVNGKNNDNKELKELQEKVKKDETEIKGEDKKEIDTKGKVEGGKTRSAVIPSPKKKDRK